MEVSAAGVDRGLVADDAYSAFPREPGQRVQPGGQVVRRHAQDTLAVRLPGFVRHVLEPADVGDFPLLPRRGKRLTLPDGGNDVGGQFLPSTKPRMKSGIAR